MKARIMKALLLSIGIGSVFTGINEARAQDSRLTNVGGRLVASSNRNHYSTDGTEDYYIPQQRTRARSDRPTLFHVMPVVSYLNSNWKGVSQTTTNYNTTGAGGTTSSQAGFGAGVEATIGLGQLKLETGLQYAQRNINYSGYLKNSSGASTSYTGTVSEKATYFEIPLLGRYSFSDPNKTNVFVHAGGVLAILQSQSSSVSGQTYAYQTGYYYPSYYSGTDASGDGTLGTLNSVDVRGKIGLGGDIKVTHDVGIIVVADYERSLSKINNSGTDSIYLEGYGLTTGVAFDF